MKWSSSEVVRFRVLVHEGKTDEEIAVELGRTVRSVAIKRQKLKMVVEQWWSGGDVVRLRVLVHEGKTDEEIAAELGRTVRSVACKRQRLKMVTRTIGASQPETRDSNRLARILRSRGWHCEPPGHRRQIDEVIAELRRQGLSRAIDPLALTPTQKAIAATGLILSGHRTDAAARVTGASVRQIERVRAVRANGPRRLGARYLSLFEKMLNGEISARRVEDQIRKS